MYLEQMWIIISYSNGVLDPEREIYCLELLKTIFDWQNQAAMINRQKSSAYCD